MLCAILSLTLQIGPPCCCEGEAGKKKKRHSEAEHMLKNTGIDIYLLLFFPAPSPLSLAPFPFYSLRPCFLQHRTDLLSTYRKPGTLSLHSCSFLSAVSRNSARGTEKWFCPRVPLSCFVLSGCSKSYTDG